MRFAFRTWFGCEDKEIEVFAEKIKNAQLSKEFTKDTFDLVMAAVNSHGSYRPGKKAKVSEKQANA